MLIISIIDKDTSFTKLLHMLIFLFSGISILTSLILISLKILKKRKNDDKGKKREKSYQIGEKVSNTEDEIDKKMRKLEMDELGKGGMESWKKDILRARTHTFKKEGK